MRSRRHRATLLLCAMTLGIASGVLPGRTAAAATPPTIAIGDITVPEGNAGVTPARVTVRLSDPVETLTVVRFATSGETATPGVDFRNRSATVRIHAGTTSAVVNVAVFGDTVAEPTETVGITLVDSGGITASDPAATVTIRDDEGVTGISIGDTEVWEGDATQRGPAKLTVVLDRPLGFDTFVEYMTLDLTAAAPADYQARNTRVKIRAGRTIAAITTQTSGDAEPESDEVFDVVITGTGTSGVVVADPIGTVTIRNDEPPATPGPPADLTVDAGPWSRHLTADWSAPASASPITGYDLEVTRGTTTNIVAGVSAPHVFGCGLAVVTDTCTVRVRARNASGDGPWSQPVTTSTWSPPAAPPNLTVLTGGGAVTWGVPTSDRPIGHYEVQKQTIGSTGWVHVSTTTSTQAATTCGGCSVRVSAYSEVGFGPWSTVAIAVPGAPTGPTATRDASDHELVHIGWSPPTDAGSHPVTSYEVYVNGMPQAPTASTNLDLYLRSTLPWSIQVYARKPGRAIGRPRGREPARGLTIASGSSVAIRRVSRRTRRAPQWHLHHREVGDRDEMVVVVDDPALDDDELAPDAHHLRTRDDRPGPRSTEVPDVHVARDQRLALGVEPTAADRGQRAREVDQRRDRPAVQAPGRTARLGPHRHPDLGRPGVGLGGAELEPEEIVQRDRDRPRWPETIPGIGPRRLAHSGGRDRAGHRQCLESPDEHARAPFRLAGRAPGPRAGRGSRRTRSRPGAGPGESRGTRARPPRTADAGSRPGDRSTSRSASSPQRSGSRFGRCRARVDHASRRAARHRRRSSDGS